MQQSSPSSLTTQGFGHFQSGGKEFVITDIHTPRPWCNVLTNAAYGVVLSHTGGGFSWIDNCQLQRLTRFDQDLAIELHGRFIYVQDLESSDSVWSTTYLPTRIDTEVDRVVHGLGYTRYEREHKGIRTIQTCFVSLDRNVEYWTIEVKNLRDHAAKIGLTSYLEWHLGSQGDWHREFHRLFMETEVSGQCLLAWKHSGLTENSRLIEELPFVAYHAIAGADCQAWNADKIAFLGSQADLSKPSYLVKHTEAAHTGRWDDPIASGEVHMELSPGEAHTVVFALGTESDRTTALARGNTISVEGAEEALQQVQAYWDDLCSKTMLQTPDEQLNTLNNHWFKVQTIAGRIQARCAYYQQGGAYGFRDQLQDSLLCLTHEPSQTLKQLGLHAEAMYEDGGVRHWWHPGSNIYVQSHHSDTCLWLGHGTLAYLDETNDLGALQNRYRFLNRDTQQFGETGTLLEHVFRGIERALNRQSSRGLPLIQAGDWNDGLSHAGIEGKGESVWLAMFLYDILTRWVPILDELGEHGRKNQFMVAAAALSEAVEKHGWDGNWYIAGTRDDGKPFGSHENTSGKLFLNPQTWAAISGIGSPERTAMAMQSVREQLFKPYGALLLSPAYATVDPYIGYITRYAPGLRENGGVYSHASTWASLALAKMGDVDGAYEIYRTMLPSKDPMIQAQYSAEPYVMPGNVDGPDSPREGRAGWTWYTGSSAWMFRVALEAIAGVRPTRAGLEFSAGPSAWDQYRVRRLFRGNTYEIEVHGHGTTAEIEVFGVKHTGPLDLPPTPGVIPVTVRWN